MACFFFEHQMSGVEVDMWLISFDILQSTPCLLLQLYLLCRHLSLFSNVKVPESIPLLVWHHLYWLFGCISLAVLGLIWFESNNKEREELADLTALMRWLFGGYNNSVLISTSKTTAKQPLKDRFTSALAWQIVLWKAPGKKGCLSVWQWTKGRRE